MRMGNFWAKHALFQVHHCTMYCGLVCIEGDIVVYFLPCNVFLGGGGGGTFLWGGGGGKSQVPHFSTKPCL